MSKKQGKMQQPPKGFKPVERTKTEKHDFSKHSVLSGIVIRVNIITTEDDDGLRTSRVALIHRGDKPVSFWESADTMSFFDSVKPGDVVWIRFDGLQKEKGQPHARKKFTCMIRQGGADGKTKRSGKKART